MSAISTQGGPVAVMGCSGFTGGADRSAVRHLQVRRGTIRTWSRP